MTIAGSTIREIQARLDEGAARHKVVGAGLAIYDDGRVHEFATGLASVRAKQAVTKDHLFLIGSTTKTYTATLLMQLVDDGLCDLDQPVKKYLPELTLADKNQEESLRVRHLLSHSSGIDNGPYDDHGRGDDAPARYVASLATLPPIHPPGQRFGYSNAAIVIAGRVVEVLTGRNWDDALRERILEPAGLEGSFSLPEHAILHPVAPGHSRNEAQENVPARKWGLCGRAMGPTGSTFATTAGDLIRFGAIHMNDGLALNGTRILEESSVRAMQQVQVHLPPDAIMADGWAIGWLWDDWKGGEVFGHTGHNLGAGSYLKFIPSKRAGVALTFNSPGDSELMHELFSFLFTDLWATTKPDPWVRIRQDLDLDLEKYAGTYRRYGLTLHITPVDGGLAIEAEDRQPFTEATIGRVVLRPATRATFGSVQGTTYTVTPPSGAVAPDLIFDGFDSAGRPHYLYTVLFAMRRTGATAR